jgi:hypothetical protein
MTDARQLTPAQAYQCGACETPYDTSEAAAACCGHSERGMSREDAQRAGLAFQQPTPAKET